VLAASTARRDGISIDGPPEVIDLKWVSGSYFAVLGVSTSIGRPLLASDDPQPPGAAVAVISDAFWTRRFGRDPTVIGGELSSGTSCRAARTRRHRPGAGGKGQTGAGGFGFGTRIQDYGSVSFSGPTRCRMGFRPGYPSEVYPARCRAGQ
jgi:hypothetical protein